MWGPKQGKARKPGVLRLCCLVRLMASNFVLYGSFSNDMAVKGLKAVVRFVRSQHLGADWFFHGPA